MGERTGIAWTDRTWNPWQGCTRVSTGCARCYMAREKTSYGQDPWTVVRSRPQTVHAPLRWERELAAAGRTERVFVCSWSDFFHEAADSWRAEAWEIIRRCEHLVFQIPTKRHERILSCLPSGWGEGWPHVWLGASAEDQAALDSRIPELLQVPAALRWLSLEPLLGQVDLVPWLDGVQISDRPGGVEYAPSLDWVVVGCESGPQRRPCSLEWVRSVVEQCRAAEVPCFVKQLDLGGRVSHDPSEWPEDLRVRGFPEARGGQP